MNEGAGSVLSPEICIVVDIRISFRKEVKADALYWAEGNSPVCVKQAEMPGRGEHRGHHRGLRPGHVLMGVVWELGRADGSP